MLPLTTLVQQCAPQVAPKTMAAIVQVESGGNPLAMWNNTTHQRILPPNREAAIAYLTRAMALGQKVDVGIAQVDTENFAAFGLTPENAFDACRNLHVGAAILQSSYAKALRHGMTGQVALFHAFEAYNSGQLWGDSSYANAVLRSAGIPVYVQSSGRMVFRKIAYVLTWSPPIAAAATSVTGSSASVAPKKKPRVQSPEKTEGNGAAYVMQW